MNLKNINIIQKVFVVLLGIVVISCADPDLAPIVTFDDAGKGAYPRLITDSETGEQLVNIQTQADYDASSYGYDLRFIDEAKGGNVATFNLYVSYYDVTSGSASDAQSLKTFSSSAFGSDENGYKTLSGVSVTSAELSAVFGLAYADMTPGDEFRVTGEIVMNDGSIFTGSNSSSTVTGGAFQGHFDFKMPVGCPSDLEMSVPFTTDLTRGSWIADADNNPVSGTVDIVAEGGGEYSFSDWSFGGYAEVYGGGTASGGFNFTDVCNTVTFVDGGDDSFGDTWEFNVYVDPLDSDVLVIEWLNLTYASGYEGGDTRLTFTGGIPFTVN